MSRTVLAVFFFLFIGALFLLPIRVQAQQPTVSIPTVTSSPRGVIVYIKPDTEDQINVRAGPGSDYAKVGIMVAGQELTGLGRTEGGNWILVSYSSAPDGTAWVYSFYVNASGELPIVEPPPPPTPQTTPTIDPTLAAQFIVEVPPTRLPTFTPPPPLVIPTYTVDSPSQGTGSIPAGFVIVGLGVIGLFGLMISLLRAR